MTIGYKSILLEVLTITKNYRGNGGRQNERVDIILEEKMTKKKARQRQMS